MMASKEHLGLSEYIKNVHQNLRLLSASVGPDQAWEDHCKNEKVLKEYAAAMKDLAMNHWVKNNLPGTVSSESRIDWVNIHCKKYFFHGELESEIKKEITLAEKHDVLISEKVQDHINCCKYDGCKLELLDVGSCYNPFKHFHMFNVTAIDLCPATDDVIQCDFLNAEVNSESVHRNVMKKEQYDVIVFSLFLEYLPSAEQRFVCCSKAYELLRPCGLLFILTPDSKHATANSKLMKLWRICLSSLGFNRIYYDKLKHLHCMAYKKSCIKDLPLRWFKLKNNDNLQPETMLKIPQDYVEVDVNSRTTFKESDKVPLENDEIDFFQILPCEEGCI